ncbi:hypothetical protein NHX12_033631 [Muraenolepis orangiensis]|uniref:Cadherin domain-containing protein n=1 Tax=Muraenolepis orangiensis TaxID=630683 RepID=A0A9Q0E6C8_9TELE|nr:hypothetical protein NHX12_033631 [Muraenolepis orangiensis]
MAPGSLLSLCTVVAVLAQPVGSCIPRSIQAHVPVTIDPGYIISQVPLGRCGDVGLQLSSSDPHFVVKSDGTIVVAMVSMVNKTRSFEVRVHTERGAQSVVVQLIPEYQQPQHNIAQVAPWNQPRKRFKRRWSPLPFNIIENEVPPFPKEVELIGSDSSVNYSVYYTIHGPGVTQPPLDLFSVVRDTGMLKVHKPVDREQYPKLVFQARVTDRSTGKETDRPLDITVLVMDVNDNAPTFLGPLEFRVAEQSSPNTDVGVVTATDRDQEGTPHSMIKFRWLTENQLFNIHPTSGMITTRSGTLDREVQATIPVTIEIRDMNGAVNGLFNTATATIRLLDINDNPPTFTHTSLKASIEENKADVLVLRIPVEDRDEVNTNNWKAKFVLVKGNENNNFRVDTDPKTNEGLLYVVKPLDHEKGKVVDLVVSAQNEVPLVNTLTDWNIIPVELSVEDVDEGPEFFPLNKVIRVKENMPNGTLLGLYTALDPETKSNAGISNPLHLVHGSGSMSGMGTVTLVIEDTNDNVPVLVDRVLVLCEKEEKRGWVTVTAHDGDLLPYSSPFNFELSGETKSKWRLRDAHNTSAVLEQVVDMPRGDYEVPLRITDLQDKGSVQVVTVRVCRCLGGQCVAHQSSVGLGAWAILALLLALAALLLLCLLFVFACNSKGEKMYIDDAGGGMLLQSNTEAPGEEVKSANLLLIPSMDGMDGSIKGAGLLDQNENMSPGGVSTMTQQTMGQHTMTQQTMEQQVMYQSSGRRSFVQQHQNNFYDSGGQYWAGANYSDSMYQKQGANLSMVNTWDTNKLYLDEKLEYFGGEMSPPHDLPHAYQYEGEGSAAGSVGCCSDMGDSDSLDFLDTLGPKFKTLASICLNKEDRE